MSPFTFPYRAAIDKSGEIWTGGMHTDRVVRFGASMVSIGVPLSWTLLDRPWRRVGRDWLYRKLTTCTSSRLRAAHQQTNQIVAALHHDSIRVHSVQNDSV